MLPRLVPSISLIRGLGTNGIGSECCIGSDVPLYASQPALPRVSTPLVSTKGVNTSRIHTSRAKGVHGSRIHTSRTNGAAAGPPVSTPGLAHAVGPAQGVVPGAPARVVPTQVQALERPVQGLLGILDPQRCRVPLAALQRTMVEASRARGAAECRGRTGMRGMFVY